MPFLSRAAWTASLIFSLLFTMTGRAAEFVDSAGRHVVLPDRIERVMPASPAAAVLIFALAPDKLIGWSEPLSRPQRAYLPAKYARLPVVGELAGTNPAVSAAEVARWQPDLIIDSGVVTPQAAALADRVEAQTRIPYIVLDGSIQQTPATLRSIGTILGVGDHRLDVASFAYHAIQGLRGKLLIQSADDRPRVYYGVGSDGLTTGLVGSVVTADIDQAGVINVATQLGRGELKRVTREQIFAWNPGIIIAQQRSFYDALRRDPEWRGLAAVRDERVFLAPALPFGWIDDPAGVNRMVGLYWLSDLFYPNVLEEDLRTNVRDFYKTYYGVQLTDRQLDALLRPAAPPAITAQGAATVSLFGAEPAPELSPRGVPGTGMGSGVPLAPPGRGGYQPNPTMRSNTPQ
jgi:iron complex transport system substrate-binding protein